MTTGSCNLRVEWISVTRSGCC